MALDPVLNPGFEVDLANWTLTDPNTSVTRTRDTVTTHGGSAGSKKMVNANAAEDDTSYQILNNAVPGGTYVVRAWLNCPAFTAGAVANRGLRLTDTGFINSADSLITAVTAGWEERVLTLRPAAGQTGFYIMLYSPQGTVYWDDVTVEDISTAFQVPAVFPPQRFGPF